MSPTKEVTNNTSNDNRNHSYANRKVEKQIDVSENREDKTDNEQPDEATIRKKESANANTIVDNNINNDSCTPALTAGINGKQEDKVHVDDLTSNDIIVSNPQTCRKISVNLETDTSGAIDDPKRGAKVNDSK